MKKAPISALRKRLFYARYEERPGQPPERCAICWGSFVSRNGASHFGMVVRLSCRHDFHAQCLYYWITKGETRKWTRAEKGGCPLCRRKFRAPLAFGHVVHASLARASELETLIDRVKGMLYGGAVGDALGSPHSLRASRKGRYIGRVYLPFVSARNRRTGTVGQITDVMEIPLALAKTIATCGIYQPDAVIRVYLAWARGTKSPFLRPGGRKLFGGLKTTKGYKRRWERQFRNVEVSASALSSCCLVRCLPLSVLSSWRETVLKDCNHTNPNRVSGDACTVYTASLRDAFDGVPPSQIFANAKRNARSSRVLAILEEVEEDKTRDDATADTDEEAIVSPLAAGRSSILDAIYCVYRALLLAKPFSATVDWVVQRGGETDTNACVAGALLGAAHGAAKLVLEDATRDNIALVREADVSQGDITPRPEECHPKTIENLAPALSRILLHHRE